MKTDADKVPGKILDDKTIEPRGYYAREIRKGEIFRIIDIEGK